MPSKNLRSLIKEEFPFELQVELDLLSRRRNLQNNAMEIELFKLFQKYGIDAVKLGMGTNRYGFKYKNYAIKFATNEDGRIDSFKEFKMSPLLQPYVIKVHEISENGVLLVTEYIQPFESFYDMQAHEDEIKKILGELSNSYLIGDVGISSVNYANWGVRVGTDTPVCLDFAYIYSVSSSIFTCPETKCRGRSMLIPNSTFSKLKCPLCGKEYKFEDIRIRIGKQQHMAEIGDLTEEGYVLTESNVLTELDTKRSPYLLARKHRKKKEKIKAPSINYSELWSHDDFMVE